MDDQTTADEQHDDGSSVAPRIHVSDDVDEHYDHCVDPPPTDNDIHAASDNTDTRLHVPQDLKGFVIYLLLVIISAK